MVTAGTILHDAARATGGQARPPAGPSDHVDGRAPAVVIEPATTAGVSAALAWASGAGLSVVVRGSGSKDAWGREPRQVDVLLRTTRLSSVIAHEASDLTATVEAGARLRDVNAQLARHGQWLPLDPPSAGEATIGGVLATNDTGPLRYRHGTPRDLLIGMTIVLADGLVASSGGRVVKNVAGYDIGRLVTGSHGGLAVITSATFKLAPLPPTSRTLRIRVVRASDALALAELIRQHQCEPDALEFRLAWQDAAADIAVLVRYASVAAAVDAACAQTSEYARQVGASVEEAEGAAADTWWRAHDATPTDDRRVQLRLSWKPAEFPQAAEALIAATRDVEAHWIGRLAVGSGLVRLGGNAARHPGIVSALRASAVFRHVVIADAPPAVRHIADVWDVSPAQRLLWQSIKDACDPRDVLGAGRGPL